jgi:hypothetical protein
MTEQWPPGGQQRSGEGIPAGQGPNGQQDWPRSPLAGSERETLPWGEQRPAPDQLPPLPPGFSVADAEKIFAGYVEAPNPALLSAASQPLLPWLGARLAQYREQKRNGEFATMQAEVTPASKITKKITRWLWVAGRDLPQQPLGEITIAAGREGAAKTQWTYWVAAHVTRGTLPGELFGKPRAVIICAREDDWEKTIVPRLEAAGADLGKVFRVKVRNITSGKSFNLSLPADNELLEAQTGRLGAALVIFDPLLSALDARLNSNRASDVRAALEPLADIAHRTGAAMTGIAHFSKMEGRDAASLVSGSHAFKDVARAMVVFARDSETTGVMSQPKNNLGRIPSRSLEYEVVEVDIQASDGWAEVSKFVMGEPTARSVEDLLDTGITRAVSAAKDFLRAELNDGEQPAKDIAAGARAHQISERTLARARKELGIRPKKHEDGTWWLSLPDTQPGSVGSLGSVGSVGSLGSSGAYPPSMPSEPRLPRMPPFPRAHEEPRRSLLQQAYEAGEPGPWEDE